MAQVLPAQVHTSLPVLHYEQIPETAQELDWADLITLDLSKFDNAGGKESLAKQLFTAIQQIGFFYVVNFGLNQQEVDRQFAIGKEFFKLSMDEKLKYRADLENGGYNGYKPLGLREIIPGIVDNIEIYNIPKFIPEYTLPHPELIKENWPEIEHFGRYINDEIVRKLLILFAIILELPENYFLDRHRYTEKSDCHLRYMKYHRRDPKVNRELGGVWIKGHTDFGSMTLLFRQPVAALQVRTPQEEWKWVKPYPESITVNIADSLSFLTNGFLKSSIHRVVVPPADQEHHDRIGVLYFVRPEDKLPLIPVESPVLQRLGLTAGDAGEEIVTAGEWVKARVKGFSVERVRIEKGNVAEEEIIGGKTAKWYN